MKRQSDTKIFTVEGVKSGRTNRVQSVCQRAPESSIREEVIFIIVGNRSDII
jgi:hypothetical protein